LICVALPAQTYAHTQERQKTELKTAKKKIVHFKIHHQQKKVTKKKKHTHAIIPLHLQKQLAKTIFNENSFALVIESLKTGISIPVFVGLIMQESTGNVLAIGTDGKGSIGLGQTTPIADKATGINCDSFNPVCSIKKIGGYLRHLQVVEKIEGLPNILMGYNRGRKGLEKYKGNPENDPYVRNVLSYATSTENMLQESPF